MYSHASSTDGLRPVNAIVIGGYPSSPLARIQRRVRVGMRSMYFSGLRTLIHINFTEITQRRSIATISLQGMTPNRERRFSMPSSLMTIFVAG